MEFVEMSSEQRRIFIDAAQLHEAYMDAYRKARSYRGGMHWKKAKGKQYLFRSLDRFGRGKSLGPRNTETEAVYKSFRENKKQLNGRLSRLKSRLSEQARLCKALRISRVPAVATSILRVLEQNNLLGGPLRVVGTNAIFCYEASAGGFFERAITATRDLDILWDVRSRLRLYSTEDTDSFGFIDILQKADRSFAIAGKSSFRAVNRTGYMVDLIKPEPKSVMTIEKRRMGDRNDLAAGEVRNLQWLISSPEFSHIVIGEDGYPAKIVCPDPRAFALHKIWLAKQPDREPIKRNRDRDQALAVCRLVLRFFPAHPFDPKDLRMFPKTVVEDAIAELENFPMPPGYDD